MMSNQEITSVIEELDRAVAYAKQGKFVVGLVGIMIDAKQALEQLMPQPRIDQNLPEEQLPEIILVHSMDWGTSGVTSCCSLPPFELPVYDRISLESPDIVTCKGPKNV